MNERTPPELRERGPWFRAHPAMAVSVALLLYASVFVLRLNVHGTEEAITLLYVLPIALLAVSFGARAGVIAGAIGVALVVAWVLVENVPLTPLGWTARVLPMLLLGLLLGAATDRIQANAAAERRLCAAEVREREAAEINDAIIQRLAAAKWALEAGNSDRGLDLLTESIETAQGLVADLLRGDSLQCSDDDHAAQTHRLTVAVTTFQPFDRRRRDTA